MKKRKEEEHENSERWLLTYSDLITLLMIFFVVMYALSNVDADKYKKISASLSVAFGNGKSIIGNDNSIGIDQSATKMDTQPVEENKLEEVKKKVDSYLKQNGMNGTVATNIDERGLVVSINDTVFFDSGSADIKPDSEKKLIDIAKILNQVGNYIRVEGHTDNVPISSYRFPSNWQLSADRAANVTELLISAAGIPPQKMSAVGYGEFRSVADNSTEAGRSKNRRVDIIIVNSKFNPMEKSGK
jgi:chemotaxis protein MotB